MVALQTPCKHLANKAGTILYLLDVIIQVKGFTIIHVAAHPPLQATPTSSCLQSIKPSIKTRNDAVY
jgi:hypothetical protein